MEVLDLVQTIAIVVSLGIALLELRRTQRLIALDVIQRFTTSHREIWSHVFSVPELARVFDPTVAKDNLVITPSERLLVIMAINHLGGVYAAMTRRLVTRHVDATKELRYFFGMPIPRKVWEDVKEYHPKEFVEFVEQRIGMWSKQAESGPVPK